MVRLKVRKPIQAYRNGYRIYLNVATFFILTIISSRTFAQKSAIDLNSFKTWESVSNSSISDNGKYISYSIYNQPLGNNTVLIQDIKAIWKIRIINADFVSFSENGRKAIIRKGADSIGIINLGSSMISYLDNITSFKVLDKKERCILAYQKSDRQNVLFLRDLLTGKEKVLPDVSRYWFSDNEKTLLIESVGNQFGDVNLRWVNLDDHYLTRIIWNGRPSSKYVFDNSGTQVAFMINGFNIWHYKYSINKTEQFIFNSKKAFETRLLLDTQTFSFNKDGSLLLIKFRREPLAIPPPNPNNAEVNIWNYKDNYLQSRQSLPNFNARASQSINAIIDINKKSVDILQDSSINEYNLTKNVNHFIIGEKIIHPYSFYQNQNIVLLINVLSGTVKELKKEAKIEEISLSPNEKFVIWFDKDSLAYFSYNIKTNETKNICGQIHVPLNYFNNYEIQKNNGYPFGIAGWIDNDQSVLINDGYDIWRVDPQGIAAPVNLTHGYGREHGIVLGIIGNNTINPNKDLLLSAFNPTNKQNGLFKIKLNSKAIPELNLGPYVYYISRTGRIDKFEDIPQPVGLPVKAKNANIWLLYRMSATQAPNVFITSDFKNFVQISDINPQQKYNWLKSELVTWKMLDGHVSQGILYKPEDFDSTKKYPLIFTFYTKRSNQLNGFLQPALTRSVIDIPTFVSNGYLIFVPDIYYPPDKAGLGVSNSIISAAKYLSKFSWVDSTKLGLQGHSFGGWETNYLITHAHLFAAACEAAGVSNQISSYGQISLSGSDRNIGYEIGFQIPGYGIGNAPWIKPELYIANSPLFSLDKISTPLLMMHNKEDGAVPFEQAIEMFIGMKRAGKKVWLLQYDKEDHVISNDINAKDYFLRMKQFFDYYLKGFPPAKWMTKGIPFRLKQVETGLEYDSSGIQP